MLNFQKGVVSLRLKAVISPLNIIYTRQSSPESIGV